MHHIIYSRVCLLCVCYMEEPLYSIQNTSLQNLRNSGNACSIGVELVRDVCIKFFELT